MGPEARNGKLREPDPLFIKITAVTEFVRYCFMGKGETLGVTYTEERLIRQHLFLNPLLLHNGLKLVKEADAEIVERFGQSGHRYFTHRMLLEPEETNSSTPPDFDRLLEEKITRFLRQSHYQNAATQFRTVLPWYT